MNIQAYFKITYGLYVVSTVNNKKLNGYISNTVFQVTSEPAQFAIACNKFNYTAEMIKQSKVFAFSALNIDAKSEIFSIFGYSSGKDIDKFKKFKYKLGLTGSPVFLEDSLAWFECELIQTFDLGTHYIFIGKVIDCDLLNDSIDPITYEYYRTVRKAKAPKNAPTYISPEKLKKKIISSISETYRCPVCGYVYDPEIGDPSSGIPPGTSFEDLPDNWICPVCSTPKSEFIKNT
jgi:flavin reductase (DIM6/NTAB) family NADH-FMN oxidoreductase RutF/rubredoxin